MKILRLFLALIFVGTISLAAQTDSLQVLTLDDCVHLALKNNFDLKLARIDNRVAERTHRQSYSNILPSLTLSYGSSQFERGPSSYLGNDYIGVVPSLPFTYQKTTGRNYFFEARVGQNIFDGGRWYWNIKKTKIEQEISNYQLLASRQNIVVTVRQLYIDLLKQQKLLQVKKQAVERSEEQLKQVQSMYEVGSAARVDVYRSEVNLGNDRIALLNQQTTVMEARQALNLAMGREPNAPLQIDTTVQFERRVGELEDLVQRALQNNPTLKTYQMSIRSASYNEKLAKSAFLPNLSAYFFYQRRVPRFKGLYDDLEREYNWYIGLSLSWNLFNGFNDYLNLQKARLNEQYAREQYEYQILNLKSKVSTLYKNLKALEEIIQVNRTNLLSAKEDYRLAQERYRLGSGTLIELRDAQVKLANAEQILVTAEFNAYLTYAELQQALGELVHAYQ